MTAEELYLALCQEAQCPGAASETNPERWWTDCSHNITHDQAQVLERAALGDIAALAEARMNCGLRPI